MPYRATPHRIPLYERCRTQWEEWGYNVVTGDGPADQPFNHGLAYTAAVANATTPIVIIADPDTLPTLPSVEEAVATVGGELVFCYTQYRVISDNFLNAPVEKLYQAPNVPGEEWRSHATVTAFCSVIRQESFWRVGGADARAYRQVDPCFTIACATLIGARRVNGITVAFDHPLETGARPDYDWTSNPILDMYRAADGDPAAMESIVADPERGTIATGVDTWKATWPSPAPGVHLV